MWHNVKLMNVASGVLTGISLLALLAAAFWWLAQQPVFSLRAIVVQGHDGQELRRVNALTVKAAVVPRLKGNFFTADLEVVRRAFEMVPWVRRAAVRREWPNKLIVSVEEHRPLGTWGDAGRLLSEKGDVFTANLAEAEADGKLLEFDGPAGSEKEVLARYAELHEWFRPIRLAPVAVQLSGRFAWTVRLSDGMTVKMGREQGKLALKDLVARLIQAYPQLTAQHGRRLDSVDLRYQNGLAFSAGGIVAGTEAKQQD